MRYICTSRLSYSLVADDNVDNNYDNNDYNNYDNNNNNNDDDNDDTIMIATIKWWW